MENILQPKAGLFTSDQIAKLTAEFSKINSMSTENWQKFEDILRKVPHNSLRQLVGIKNLGYLSRKIIREREHEVDFNVSKLININHQ